MPDRGLSTEHLVPLEPATAWFYLSFATDQDGFLGGLYIEGADPVSAYLNATLRKLNPGGEVAIIGPLPTDELDAQVPPENRNRLLARAEVEGE